MGIKKCIVLMTVVAIVMAAMVAEVEGLSCMDKCMFECGLILMPQKACEEKCLRKCHIPPGRRLLE
ncbi:unnamed protein product [Thlaspi arvense]|uniref:Plant thionin family protein n=1 Tax=Thlaspi arvense TaxID=13288 RepID=A0AAU9SHM2_THLAR|nr:unnamed protein product [Thlaspi arvense]